MKIRLLRPIAQHAAGAVIDRRDSEASALVRSGAAEYVIEAPVADAEPVDDAPALDDTSDADDDEAAPEGGTVTGEGSPTVEGQSLAELQARASDLGLPRYGTKAQLAERIMNADTKS